MRRILVLLAVLALGVNAAAAYISIDRRLPYSLPLLDRHGARADVERDFLFGFGTALTVPMAVLAAMAVFTVLASFTRSGGRLGALLLALTAALVCTAVLLEPYARTRLEQGNLEAVESGLVLANLGLCALVVLVGLAVAATTPRTPYR